MYKVGNIEIHQALMLAPMEEVSDPAFRLVCKELGADVVFTEFVNTEGLVRGNERTHNKLLISDEERPIGIQIYGKNIDAMVRGALIAEREDPELIDINAGCWVKNIASSGAGAGLLKNPEFLQKMVKEVVDAVNLPVTVKTRIGWDSTMISILDIAKRIEDAGAKSLTIHCRTRAQGHSGDADWSWIPRVKEVVNIPIVLNGGVFTAKDVLNAFNSTGADGVMIARGAIGNPWIFHEAKEILKYGEIRTAVDYKLKIATCLRHLRLAIATKSELRAIYEHRKYYSGYLKNLRNSAAVRNSLMKVNDYVGVEKIINDYLVELDSETEPELQSNI